MGIKVVRFENDYKPSVPVVEYDDIVDRTKYIADKETVRNFSLSGQGAENGQLLYDDETNPPSDFEVKLRQGQVDKGEVFQRQLSLQEEIKETDSDSKKSKAKAKQQKIEEARQAHLDSITGFVPPAESSAT